MKEVTKLFGTIDYIQLAEFLWTIKNKWPITKRSNFVETSLSGVVTCKHKVIVGHWGTEATMLTFWKDKECPTCQAKGTVQVDLKEKIKNPTFRKFFSDSK